MSESAFAAGGSRAPSLRPRRARFPGRWRAYARQRSSSGWRRAHGADAVPGVSVVAHHGDRRRAGLRGTHNRRCISWLQGIHSRPHPNPMLRSEKYSPSQHGNGNSVQFLISYDAELPEGLKACAGERAHSGAAGRAPIRHAQAAREPARVSSARPISRASTEMSSSRSSQCRPLPEWPIR